MQVDVKLVGGILFGVIAGVAGYIIGKQKCAGRHPYHHEGKFHHPHPQMMFRGARKEQ